jgi:hypothetical protein
VCVPATLNCPEAYVTVPDDAAVPSPQLIVAEKPEADVTPKSVNVATLPLYAAPSAGVMATGVAAILET